jgi:signal transduction histidine kinase
MPSSVTRRSPVARSRGAVLIALAASAALLGAVEFSLFPASGFHPVWALDLFPAGGLVYAAAGLAALWRRPSNGLGVIMFGGALIWLAVALANTAVTVLAAGAAVLASVPLAIIVHLLLAFPSGRLRSQAARWITALAYVTTVVLQVPEYLFVRSGSPGGMLAAADNPGLAAAGLRLQQVVGLGVMLATAVVLAARLRRASRQQRRVLLPLDLYGIAAVLLTPLMPIMIKPLTGMSDVATAAMQVIALCLVPVAFAAGMMRGGFARTSEIQELGAWLAADTASRPSLEQALARALGDDSVRLAYWVPAKHAYTGADGRPVAVPGAGHGRASAEISLGSRRIGAITYDATLIEDPALVQAAGQVAAIAMDRERLTAELLASQDELRESRARLVSAADAERRRIAQNLHDGLQTKLVLIALEAQQLAGQPGAGAGVAAAATALRGRIDAAAAELRELVHAVMPASLIERGLAAATEDLADRMPLATQLDIAVDGPLPGAVSATAYFVIAEGLANAVKHAQASKLGVSITRTGDTLHVEVRDDGTGGAAPGSGLGLRSLADRADTLGGRLFVTSEAGLGTSLRAELPCGS